MSIGVLLTSHRRPHTLRKQLAAIDAQTLPPDELVIFHDHAEGVQPDTEAMRGRRVIATNWTGGVWNRFAFCLWGFHTDFIAVLDDDTIPAPNWLMHCMDTWCQHTVRPLIGVNGVTFPIGHRSPREYWGWDRLDNPVCVDIVGHGWFFHRGLVRDMAQRDKLTEIDSAGEDYAISFAARRSGYDVIVPSTCDPSTLGSTMPDLGNDDVALYRRPGEDDKKNAIHEFYLARGWRPLALSEGRDAT